MDNSLTSPTSVPPLSRRDSHFLSLALDEAEKALPLSHPNPAVGCVIVSPSGDILVCGYTQRAGGLHAEAMALRHAAQQGVCVEGATAYVTLEPCAHQGRTPPCARALVEAKIARVVCLLQDPNPLVAGRGIAILQSADVETLLVDAQDPQASALLARAQDQMRGFLQRMRHGKPWVRLKIATSLDGFTALDDGQSQWITGPSARQDTHWWRARAGFIVSGIGTLLADKPQFNVRGLQLPNNAEPQQPHLAILDRQLRTPLPQEFPQEQDTRQTFWDTLQERDVLIFCDASAYANPQMQPRIAALRARGAEVLSLPTQGNPLVHVRKTLFERGANEIHIEAGPELSGAWIEGRLVDELLLYLAPKLLASGKPMFHLPALENLQAAKTLHLFDMSQVGQDARIRALFAAPGAATLS